MAVLELNKDNFDETIDNNDIVILDFWAPWCGPCKQFAPTYEAISEKIDGVTFAKINTEDQQELGAKFQIRSIPTLMIFREQIAIFSQPGAMSESDLKTVLNKAKELDMEMVRKEITEKEAKTRGILD
ncbi:MAG TPA: thioredoxin [Psychromonas hadalis]|nr:thioredoxin [Gammaproteobacteria bacterium]HIP75973.1 thioredoxin [Psychromonas hadalis]